MYVNNLQKKDTTPFFSGKQVSSLTSVMYIDLYSRETYIMQLMQSKSHLFLCIMSQESICIAFCVMLISISLWIN